MKHFRAKEVANPQPSANRDEHTCSWVTIIAVDPIHRLKYLIDAMEKTVAYTSRPWRQLTHVGNAVVDDHCRHMSHGAVCCGLLELPKPSDGTLSVIMARIESNRAQHSATTQ